MRLEINAAQQRTCLRGESDDYGACEDESGVWRRGGDDAEFKIGERDHEMKPQTCTELLYWPGGDDSVLQC